MDVRRMGTSAGFVLAVTIAVAGCGSDGVKSDPAISSAPTASASSTPVDENAAILAAYTEFFNRQTEISMAPKEQRKALLEPFTTDPALQRVLGGMFAAEDLGEVGYGQPVLDPRVANIDGDRATIRDCQDNSQVGRKKVRSGKVTTHGFRRDNAKVGMIRGADGSWRVATVEYLDEKC